MNKTKYPLYSGEICGDIYDDKGKCYMLVRITQWTNRTKNAKEILHKTYYFEKTNNIHFRLSKILDDEDYCMQIFNKPECSKLKIKEEIKIVRC